MTFTLALTAKNPLGLMKECFDSIFHQSDKPDVVMLVLDDASTPAPSYLQEYGVAVVQNRGKKIYHARNTALALCATDILAFTDTDCVLDAQWVRRIKEIFRSRPDVAAGTGSHPMIGKHNLSSWLHHMWFVVETKKTGYTNGVIGGNSYFRTDALKKINGWLSVNLMAAEDVYISMKLLAAGYKLWFDEAVIARHHYKAELTGLLRQSVMMGYDIVVMMRTAHIRGFLWYYTLAIPVLAAIAALSLFSVFAEPITGVTLLLVVLLVTLAYLIVTFGSFSKGITRWLARWIIIWPYAFGIIKGLLTFTKNRTPGQ
jgi:cellulose synthase/poly-beta-1,6-N-acetylglucosamine synthase-like glycosyltransferase